MNHDEEIIKLRERVAVLEAQVQQLLAQSLYRVTYPVTPTMPYTVPGTDWTSPWKIGDIMCDTVCGPALVTNASEVA